MNKFIILILFIALIYLAYSYRHDIMRGGFQEQFRIRDPYLNDNEMWLSDNYHAQLMTVSYKHLHKALTESFDNYRRNYKEGWKELWIADFVIIDKNHLLGTVESSEMTTKKAYIEIDKLLNNGTKNPAKMPVADMSSSDIAFIFINDNSIDKQPFELIDYYGTVIPNKDRIIPSIILFEHSNEFYRIMTWKLLDSNSRKNMYKVFKKEYIEAKNTKEGVLFQITDYSPGLFVNSGPDNEDGFSDEQRIGMKAENIPQWWKKAWDTYKKEENEDKFSSKPP